MDLLQEQIKLEEEAVGYGKQRYFNEVRPYDDPDKKRMPASLSETKVGTEQIKVHFVNVSNGIRDWCADALAGNAGRGAPTAKFIDSFDPEVLAFLTIKCCLNTITVDNRGSRSGASFANTCIQLADCVLAELNYETFKDEARGYYEVIWKKIKQSNDMKYRRAVLSNSMSKANVNVVTLTPNEKVHIGTRLLEIFINSTGLITVVNQNVGKKLSKRVVPTKEALEYLVEATDFHSINSPVFMPMVVKPNAWDAPAGGGYLSPWVSHDFRSSRVPAHLKDEYTGRLTFIKTDNFKYLEDLRHREIDDVYRAVNILQDTPWSINQPVLRVLEEMWERGAAIGDMPSRDLTELPAKPHDIDTNEEARFEWRKAASRVREDDIKLISKRYGIMQKVWLANKFSKYEEIFFPHTLDWRGRAYPVASLVNPQADDVGKSLIHFAEGKRIGEYGGYWLAVHIANSFGYDKCSLDDRVAWVQENEQFILDSAIDPCDGIGYWTQADKPWQFLASCFEWLGFKTNGDDHITHLPIGMDGSCNGLQNFSAMLRDEIGGEATNLTPSKLPSDIYQRVADLSITKLKFKASEGDEIAAQLTPHVTRKVVKRPVMTKPYAATHDGMRKQMVNELPDLEDYTAWELSKYLTPIVDESIGEIVVAANQVMNWLKQTARTVAARQIPIRWMTPLGLPVLQQYNMDLSSRVKTHFGSANIRINVMTMGSRLDKKKQALGIAPNFVHSMDSSHMMITTLKCDDEGVSNLAMVHDSFGTHACDVDKLNELLRDAFVEQYEGDVLGEFRSNLIDQVPEEIGVAIEPLPEYGSLDLEGVRESDYFFS